MKKLILIFAINLANGFAIYAQTNYYLSATGSDSNNGTSTATPWKSITKLNTVNYVAGDTVFFKSGDVFRGNIIVNQGGNSSKRVVFTSYGSGNKPVISGAELLTSWTVSGNNYTAAYTGTVTNFFVDGKEQTLARYPNEHSYLTLDSGQTTYLKDASISSLNSNLITGSKICVHSSQWSWEKATVSSFSGTKIDFGSMMLKAINNYGYFLYDNINHLDTANEWQYDATAHIMYYHPASGVNPNNKTCEIAVYQNGIEFGANVSYISLLNLAFEKQANIGVKAANSSNKYIIVNNCYFQEQYNHGINFKGKYCQISNSYFREVDGMAVYIYGSGSGSCTVDHNTFKSNGITRANGLGGQLNGTALMCASDSNYFHHNFVDSAGYCGISADGKRNIVERNIVDHPMLIENDGGGVKGWEAGTTESIYRNNFISNCNGNTEGCYQASFLTPAIYFDFNVNNCTISDNTVYDCTKRGIFQNSSNHHNTITNNVIYGGSTLLDLNGSNLAPNPQPINNMIIKHNSFFARDNNALIIRQIDYSVGYNTGTIDSNYYFQPYNVNRYAMRMNGTTPTYYNFSNWQATGNDAHTKSSYVNWTYPTDSSQLFMNQTDNVSNVSLGSKYYKDLDGNLICGTLTLQPYTSKILIKTNTNCSVGISEGINYSSIVVYPNPANTILNIQGVESGSAIQIIDMKGRKVLDVNNFSSNKLNIEQLESGIYFINIISNGGEVANKKFIKQ